MDTVGDVNPVFYSLHILAQSGAQVATCPPGTF